MKLINVFFLVSLLLLAGCRTRYLTQEVQVDREVLKHDTVTVTQFRTIERHDTVKEVVREQTNTTTVDLDSLGRIIRVQLIKSSKGTEKAGTSHENATEVAKTEAGTKVVYKDKIKEKVIEKSKPWHERVLEKLGYVFIATLLLAGGWLAFRYWRKTHTNAT